MLKCRCTAVHTVHSYPVFFKSSYSVMIQKGRCTRYDWQSRGSGQLLQPARLVSFLYTLSRRISIYTQSSRIPRYMCAYCVHNTRVCDDTKHAITPCKSWRIALFEYYVFCVGKIFFFRNSRCIVIFHSRIPTRRWLSGLKFGRFIIIPRLRLRSAFFGYSFDFRRVNAGERQERSTEAKSRTRMVLTKNYRFQLL